jgi:hypothetical protein
LRLHGDQLAKSHAVDLDRRVDLADDAKETRGYVQSPIRNKKGVGWLLAPKIDPLLFEEMVRCGLAVDGATRGAPGWFAFDERFLDVYMTTLANEVIGQRPVETVTDVPKHFRLFTVSSLDALRESLLTPASPAGAAADDHVNMMALAIETVCPAGIDHLPIEAVLELRETSAAPRAAFKGAIKEMVNELQTIRAASLNDQLHASDLEALRKKHIAQPLAELKKSMRGVHGDAIASMLTLKSPLEAGTAGALVLGAIGVGSGVLAAVGIAIGAFQVWRTAKKSRDELLKSPMAWLLDVEAKANAQQAVQQIIQL